MSVVTNRRWVSVLGSGCSLLAASLSLNALAAAPAAQLAQRYGQLPLRFEANRGQTDAQVEYLSRGPGYALFLTRGEAVMALRQADAAGGAHSVLRWTLQGARKDVPLEGEQALPGVSHYLIGNDPNSWHTGAQHYAQLRQVQVYPGIDLVYHGAQQLLEYDFVVAPGADPAQLRMRISGAQRATLNARGDLVLSTAAGDLVQNRPVLYQDIDGQRRAVQGAFVTTEVGADIELAFVVGDYDRSQPLVIDPTLAFSSYLGGTGTDIGFSIALDAQGHAYLTGTTASLDFPVLGAAQAQLAGGESDAFVSKLDPSGASLLYSTYLGGTSVDVGRGIAVDSSGSAVLTGYTSSADFPSAGSPLQRVYRGGMDAFVAKLDASGALLSYSTFLGGTGADYGYGVALDASGKAYVTGSTFSTDFPLALAAQAVAGGNGDSFVAKIDYTRTGLLYSTYLGGTSVDQGASIAVDDDGRAHVTGVTSSLDFPLNSAPQPVFGGAFDAFVTRMSADGSSFAYSSYLGGSDSEFGYGIAVNGGGSAYVTGSTASSDFPVVAAVQPALGGGGSTDAFVTRFKADGTGVEFSTYLGGSDADLGYGIALDGDSQPFVTGSTSSEDFPVPEAPYEIYGGGLTDAFIAKYDKKGSTLLYGSYFGASGAEYGYGIVANDAGYATLTGYTASVDLLTLNPVQAVYGGGSDAFIAQLDDQVAGDSTPDAFDYLDITSAAAGTVVKSANLTLSGFDGPLPVSISGGSYRINSGSWVTSAGSIMPGNTVQLKVTASSTPGATRVVSLVAGSRTDSWSVTTTPDPDTTPDPFAFNARTGVNPNVWVTSENVKPSGYDTPTPITVVGGQYRTKMDGVWSSWTSAEGSLTPGSTVQMRVKSASATNTTTTGTLTIGGVSASFSVTTAP